MNFHSVVEVKHAFLHRCGGVFESGQRVQVEETGAVINTATKAPVFRSACVSLRQVDWISVPLCCAFCVFRQWISFPPPPQIEEEWKPFFEPEICHRHQDMSVWTSGLFFYIPGDGKCFRWSEAHSPPKWFLRYCVTVH